MVIEKHTTCLTGKLRLETTLSSSRSSSGRSSSENGGRSLLSGFFFKVPRKGPMTFKWNNWRTRDNAQDLEAVCLLEPASRADKSEGNQYLLL